MRGLNEWAFSPLSVSILAATLRMPLENLKAS